MFESDPTLLPPLESLRDKDILGGAARYKTLEAFLDLKIPELLGKEGPMQSRKICEKLNIIQNRGWKFLHVLALGGMLEETNGTLGEDNTIFGLSKDAKQFFGDDGTGGFFYKDLVAFHRSVADLPLLDVLHGMALPDQVHRPPTTLQHAKHLENWMKIGAIQTLLRSDAMAGDERLLDVGGGDGFSRLCSV